MQAVWDEAHAMFKERVQQRLAAGPIQLDAVGEAEPAEEEGDADAPAGAGAGTESGAGPA